MANKSPLESVMGFTVSADVTQAMGEFEKLNAKIKESEDNVKSLTSALNMFEGSGKSFVDGMVGVFSQIASVIEMVVLAPAKLDNFMGVMNQRITTVGDQLERYRNIVNAIKGESLGISADDRQKLMAGFTSGATGSEKYGVGAEGRAAGFARGGAQLMRGMGLSAETSSEVLTSLRKNVGLVSAEMVNYSKQLSAIGRTSNMTAGELGKQIKNSIGLARAYGLAGKGAQEFVLTNMRVSSAVSQMGLNVESTMKKLHEVSTGSEEGLIQSLLMGFQPGDTEGALGGMKQMAQFITSKASGAGQAEPYLIRQMADQLGMKQFSVEDIQKMAQGISVEGEKETTQKDVVSLLSEIKDALTKPEVAAESPYTTAANIFNDTISKFTQFMENTFKPLLDDMKTWMVKLNTEFFPALKDIARTFHEIFNTGLGSLKGIALAVGATLVTIGLVKKGLEVLITRIARAVTGIGSRGPGGLSIPGPLGGTTAGTSKWGKVAKGLGTVAKATGIGGVIGGLAEEGMEWYGGYINRKADNQLEDSEKKQAKLDEMKAALKAAQQAGDKGKEAQIRKAMHDAFGTRLESAGQGSQETPKLAPSSANNLGMKQFSVEDIKKQAAGQVSQETPKLAPSSVAEKSTLAPQITKGIDIAKKEGFEKAKFTTTGGTHKEGSQHYVGKAFDVGTKGFSAEQVASLKKKLEKEVEGLNVIDETDEKKGKAGQYGKDWTGPHLHAQLIKTAEEASKTAVAALTPAQKGKAATTTNIPSLTGVADVESHRLLSNVHSTLIKLADYMVNGTSVLAGETENQDNLAGMWRSS